MRRLAITSAIVSTTAVVLSLVSATLDPGTYSLSSISLIAVGLLSCTLVAITGLLLVRAPWGRWGLVATTGSALLLATVNDNLLGVVVFVVGGIAIVGLAGPWLRFWVRQHPVPDALNAVVVALMVVAPVSPVVVGVAAYDSASFASWLTAAVAVGSSFAYGRGMPGSIWAMRLAVPFGAVPAVVVSPFPHVLLVGIGALVVTGLAWLPAARQATATPPPVLPTPHRRKETVDAGE